MKRAEKIAWLKRRGVHRNQVKTVEKEFTAALDGMIERHRTREEARDAGATPCPDHEGEFVGNCPWCRGIWRRAEES